MIDSSAISKIGVGGSVAVLVLSVLAVAAAVIEVVLCSINGNRSDGNGESGSVAENNAYVATLNP